VESGRPGRFLFVLEYYYPHIGGVEVLFQNLAAALVAAGHRVTVLTLRPPGAARQERLNGVDVVRVDTPRWAPRYWFMPLAVPAALRLARKADLIHTTTYNAALPGWVASMVCRKPAAITVHEVFAEQWHTLPGLNAWLGYGFRLFEWGILHLPFAHYFCPSQFTRGRLIRTMGIPGENVSVAYNAIDYDFWDLARQRPRDLKRELGLAPGSFVYLYFGRPGISKGVEYLLDAVPLVRRRLPGSRLVLLMPRDPPGPYHGIVRRIHALGITGDIVLLDAVPRADLPGYLMAADCVVVPSVSEGFGYAAAEAALLGCPVVATAGHAVEEILGPAVRLVPPRDPGALADAVTALARSRPARPGLPRRYDQAQHVAATWAAYAALLPHVRPR
jgi:glycosyltransferase involved in cell wall biosynthesis